jgi:stearoyl-CoA desaturase (Delta-9 desaturase)
MSRARERSSGLASRVPFVVCHAVPLAALWTGVTATSVVLLVTLYASRVFFITAGYHRYFAHRGYRMGRVPQFLMALGGLTAVQKGPLWWAANHRRHHRYADTDRDPHSPQRGFWWAHIGWALSGDHNDRAYDEIADFARFPELRFLDRHDWIGPWGLGVASFLLAGWPGVVVGFFGSTVVLWHTTFSVNSLAHMVGRRRYATNDTSRNLWPLAIVTFGEGWHNNHHHFPASARQGFTWWQLDVSYLVLRGLAWVRVVHDLRLPSPAALAARRVGQAGQTGQAGPTESTQPQAGEAATRSQAGIAVDA